MSFTINRYIGALIVACTASVIIISGCSNSQTATSDASPAAGASPATAASPAAGASPAVADAAAGQTGYNTSCARCHGAGGQRKNAPDLSHFGSDPEHTAQWIADYVKNPKSKDPGSRMPPFEGKLPDDKIQAIAAYVASLK